MFINELVRSKIPLQPCRENLQQVCIKLVFLRNLFPYTVDLRTICGWLSQDLGMGDGELAQQVVPSHFLTFEPILKILLCIKLF